MPYPVTYSIPRPERYNRWTVGFRWVLGIPLFLLLSSGMVSSHSGASAGPLVALLTILVLYAWFTILFTGNFPPSMRSTSTMLFRWLINIEAYLALLTANYPPFGEGAYPVELAIIPAERYNRWTVFFRAILVIPHVIILIFLTIAQVVITVIAWFAILFTGQYPPSMYDFSVGVQRWGVRVSAYIYLLVDEYPPFSLSDEAGTTGLQPQTA